MDEKIYECEAKKLVLRNGVKVREWRVVPVRDVIEEKLEARAQRQRSAAQIAPEKYG
jgi:hypothetical protein